VSIDQEINSYQAVASAANADVSSLFGNWIYQNTNNKHNKVLPSANLKFHMSDDVVFRFAASQTMTLPDYSALGASSWGSDLNKTGGGGNPNLKPVISTNFDGNLEWYFMPRGLVSVGAFAMDLKDYVAFGTESRQLFSELSHQLETYLVSVPVNSNGSVSGLELVYEQPATRSASTPTTPTRMARLRTPGPTAATTWWAPRRTPTTWASISRTRSSRHGRTTAIAPRS
jgi:iron complex outermembrane receptor protein